MLLIEGKDCANIVKGLIDRLVVDRLIPLRSDQFAGEITFREAMLGVVDRLLRLVAGWISLDVVCGSASLDCFGV